MNQPNLMDVSVVEDEDPTNIFLPELKILSLVHCTQESLPAESSDTGTT
jgi:hypothetical protein